LTDDIKFARKRLVNPNTVYSGVIDVLSYDLIDYSKPESFEVCFYLFATISFYIVVNTLLKTKNETLLRNTWAMWMRGWL
jgi:hypothetical protein